MNTEALRALEKAVELVAKATPGPWLYRAKSNTFHGPPPEGTNYSFGYSIMAEDEDLPTFKDEDIDAILGAVNFIREHGSAILATASEQAPVAWEYRVRGIDAIWVRGEGSINADYNNEYWEVRYLYDHPSSPAYTSEARDAARFEWLCGFDCGINHLRFGDYEHYSYAEPAREHGRRSLREVCDAAMRQEAE